MDKSTILEQSSGFDRDRLAMEVQMLLLEHEENELQKKLIPESQMKVVNKKNKDLVWKLVAHSLYGIVVLKETESEIMIRLDPCCKGVYLEYFILELHKIENEWSIVSHNLPEFMSLKMMVQDKNEGKAREMINDCDDYLRSYAYRKFQVLEAMEYFPKFNFDYVSTYSYVAIRFQGMEKMRGIKVNLRYGPYDELPVDIDFEVEESQDSVDKRIEMKNLDFLFRKKFIAEALKTLETE